MGITYKVEWLQEICGMNFCVARCVFNEKEVSKEYELFVLNHNRTNPIWGQDIRIAEYSIGRYFEEDLKDKGLMTDYFQKKIQEVVAEEVRIVYDYIESRRKEALGAIYPSWGRINLNFNLDRYEMEQICLLLKNLGYLRSFYTTSNGVCLQVRARNLYEKFCQITF